MSQAYLKYILGAAVFLSLLATFRGIGFHQSDEHYQILEFAAMRAGISPVDDLPWEYAEQMRPGLQPLMAYAALKTIKDPFWTAWFLRLLSAAYCFLIGYLVFQRYRSGFQQHKAVGLFAVLCFLHWIMLYSGGRFASESWSGLTLALGFLLYPLKSSPLNSATCGHQLSVGPWGRYILVGLLFGLAFEFRYQMAVAILGFGAWLLIVAKERWLHMTLVVAGGLLALGLGSLADCWLYGEWVNAPWNYLEQNLLEGKAATFGTRPWWGYFELIFLRGIPPLSLLYIALPLWFFWRFRRDPISWMWLPFILVHVYLSRKDIRFLWPLLPLLPVVLARGWQSFQQAYPQYFRAAAWRYALGLMLALNLGIVLVNSLRPLHPSVAAARFLYHQPIDGLHIVVPGKGRPYHFYDLPAHFYRPANMQLVSSCPPAAECWYLLCTEEADPPAGTQLLWSEKPAWLPALGRKWYRWYGKPANIE